MITYDIGGNIRLWKYLKDSGLSLALIYPSIFVFPINPTKI
jgi:hypothetical protein